MFDIIKEFLGSIPGLWAIYGATVLSIGIPLIKTIGSRNKADHEYKGTLINIENEMRTLKKEQEEHNEKQRLYNEETRSLLLSKQEKNELEAKKQLSMKKESLMNIIKDEVKEIAIDVLGEDTINLVEDIKENII